MRKQTFLLACLFMASIGMVNAQSTTASGKVISAEDGQPVIGASIFVKGTNQGAVSDVNGQFSVNMPGTSKTLVISYIGMKQVEVRGQTNMVIRMESAASELDEVIVVAYGTAKKSAFTGSAAVMSSEKINLRQVSNVTQALTGQVAGVQVTNANGQPGSAPTIRIRGINSMNSSTTPLYVVDGIPFDGNLASINPNDIESMSVLKDAAASAIYGARGANGVVMITTKSGQTKEAKVTVDAKWGSNSRGVSNYDVMTDPAMYYETFYKALYNSKAHAGSSADDAHVYARNTLFDESAGGLGYQVYTVPSGEYFIGTNFKLNPNATLGYSDGDYYYTPDNWYNELFDEGNLRQEYNASVSGSSDKINYFFSFGYLDDSGIVSGSGFSRYTARSKVDYQAKEWLKVGANMSYTNYNIQAPGSQTDWGSSGNLFYTSNMIAPIYPMYVRNADGTIKTDANGLTVYDFGTSTNETRAFMALSNPAIELMLDQHNAYTDVITNKWYAIIDILEGLQFNANIGANIRNQRASNLYNKYYGSSVSDGGAVSVEHYREVGINQQYLLTYKKSFGDHSFDLLAGYEHYKLKEQDISIYNKTIYNPYVAEIGNTVYSPATVDSYTDSYQTAGFLTRLQYNYNEKIFASASYRRDGSSHFAPEHRWGNFGSLSGAWIISKEGFFDNLGASWLNMLKLKASYGVVGNDKLPNSYSYLDQYQLTASSDGGFAPVQTFMGTYDITWESSYSTNIGIEFAMLNEHLNGSIDYFNRDTKDLLYNAEIPLVYGFATRPMNVGSINNKGVELDLNYDIIKNKDITWSVGLNATSYKNTITDLAEVKKKLGGMFYSTYCYTIGGSLYDVYLRDYAGVDPETGKALYYVVDSETKDYVLDADGNKTTTDDWNDTYQINLGGSLPKVYGGFNTSFAAYGFDVSASFSYQLGGRMYDFSYEELMHNGDQAGVNWHMDILNAWTEENRNTDVPRLNSADDSYQLLSSRFLVSSNYLSLNNLTIGYTIPSSIIKNLRIQSLRVYFAGDNLALLTARKGLDPRQDIGVVSYLSTGSFNYTALKTVSGGISLTF